MNGERIYITGMGAVTPVGIGVTEYWRGLVEGRCGIRALPEESGVSVPRAALVPDYIPERFLPKRLVQDLEPYMQYAYLSAEDALVSSGLDASSERVGIVMGTALAGIAVTGQTAARYEKEGRPAGPKLLTKAMGNIAAAQLAIAHGITGPSLTVSTACSSGADAVLIACLLLRSGAADAAVVMAGESALCPTLVQSLLKTGALSKTGESRPFDASRNGFVLGEGGGALVLERETHVRLRGGEPIAEILGCANSCDAFNPVSPEPEGRGAAACISLALKSAGLLPEQVDYINAHGTATVTGDLSEARAIRAVFGSRDVPVSSLKGATGHMMGAGGITELIACVKAITTGILPPNIGCTKPDADCGLNIVTEACGKKIKTAMSNSFGFGGQNSCIIIGKGIR